MSRTSSSSISVWQTWLTQHSTAPSTLFLWKISRLKVFYGRTSTRDLVLETGCLGIISAELPTSWPTCPSWPLSAAIAAWQWRDTWPSHDLGALTCPRRLVFNIVWCERGLCYFRPPRPCCFSSGSSPCWWPRRPSSTPPPSSTAGPTPTWRGQYWSPSSHI